MTLSADDLGKGLKNLGFDFYCGVPCSFLKDLINFAINEVDFVMNANEGDAVATAAGAYLAGRKSIVLMQNSGLTNATSPITSLNFPFKIPVLGFVSLRGEEGIGDEPQHELMGTITTKMLEMMEVEWEYLENDISKLQPQLERANDCVEKGKCFFFVVKKGTLGKVSLKPFEVKSYNEGELRSKNKEDQMPTRLEVLERINKNKDAKSAVLATTGKTGRELYEVEDSKQNLYMVGSMGCISSFSLGVAMANKSKNAIAIDGDGSLMMRMGNLATVGYYSPDNLIHVLIDNETHDSTGGQFTVSKNIDFVSMAASSGYARSYYIHSLEELDHAFDDWYKDQKLTFLYIRVQKGSKANLGRPKIKPYEVKERLMEFLRE